VTTYEHGKQPDGAPVTWQRVGCSVHGTVYELNDTVHWSMFSSEESADEACRAFHLAKLAEEASKIGDKASDMHDSSCFVESCNHLEKSFADWLRRYREAVR